MILSEYDNQALLAEKMIKNNLSCEL